MITSFYVRRTARIHPLRPHNTHTEPIDGDTTAAIRPYLAEQEHADRATDTTTPCWIHDLPAGRAS
jgi:hypothetical protein